MNDGYSDLLYRYDIKYNKIYLSIYTTRKKTNYGYWINMPNSIGSKFVNLEARKQFTSETKEQALEGFMRRKYLHQKHLKDQLKEVESAIKLVESGDFEGKEVLVDGIDFQLM